MISVADLLNSPNLKSLKIIAGRKGLGCAVSAVSIMDAPDSYKWLKGGEFILTTGYLFGGDEWQIEHYVANLIEAGCSAVGIKRGRFIRAIPQSVLETADTNNFPIIEIPHYFGWSEIISVFYYMQYARQDVTNPENTSVAETKQKDSESVSNEDAFREFLLKLHSGDLTPGDITRFEKSHISGTDIYYCVLLAESGDNSITAGTIYDVLNEFRLTGKNGIRANIISVEAGQILIVLLQVSINKNNHPGQWHCLLLEELEYSSAGTAAGNIYMGGLYTGAEGIAKSYREAAETRNIGPVLWSSRHIFSYQAVSIYSALRGADSSKIDIECINLLHDFREKLGFDAIESLEAYIEHGGYKEAASALFIHSNTLRYRIEKIAGLLHMDLDDKIVCNNLLMQLNFWKLKQQEEG